MTALITAMSNVWPAVREQAGSLGWDLPELSLVWTSPIDCKSLTTSAAAEVERQALEAAENDLGWVRYRSAAFDGSLWSGDDAARGPLMWAEWADKNTDVSYRLTPDSRKPGGTMLYIHRESPIAAENWLPVFAQDVILQGHQAGRDLQYRVYWGAYEDDVSAVRRLFTRFVRFTRKGST